MNVHNVADLLKLIIVWILFAFMLHDLETNKGKKNRLVFGQLVFLVAHYGSLCSALIYFCWRYGLSIDSIVPYLYSLPILFVSAFILMFLLPTIGAARQYIDPSLGYQSFYGDWDALILIGAFVGAVLVSITRIIFGDFTSLGPETLLVLELTILNHLFNSILRVLGEVIKAVLEHL